MKKTSDSKETRPRASRLKRSGRSADSANNSDQGAGDLALAEAPAPTETEATGSAHAEDRSFASESGKVHSATTLQGRIERISGTAIAGWVWDPDAPDRRVCLELLEGKTCLKTTVAADDRPDLTQLGCGDGRHGFTIELEQGLLAEGRHTLVLRCADTGAGMPGSPIALRSVRTAVAEAQEPSSALRHHIDEVSNDGIVGWVMMPEQPSNRSVVALKHDGQTIAKAVATLFRADLLAAGVGDGCYGFELPLPPPLADGRAHMLEIVEEARGISLTNGPVQWRPGEAIGTTTSPLARSGNGHGRYSPTRRGDWTNGGLSPRFLASAEAPPVARRHVSSEVGTRILFDISDLIYYIGNHPNLTGIQRVQSSIVLSIFDGKILPSDLVTFLSFNAITRDWVMIPTGFLVSFLRDLFLPETQRLISFDPGAARCGILPGAQPFDGARMLDDGSPSVLCLLGAAWVQQDYVHRVLSLKREFGTRFVMMVHDLIPIYARETCDQDTVRVFEQFMWRALRHVDHVLAVSESTASDVRRYIASLGVPEPQITVTRNGSSFAEFLPQAVQAGRRASRKLPERFVLFVGTVEGRKNHRFIFDVWRRMLRDGDDPPHLICVGRLGWKASAFINPLVESKYLNGRVHLLRDISDFELRELYDHCLFTVYPTLYEGWGLPVGESLALGKICVCSNRTAMPEVAGECGVYIDVDNIDRSADLIRDLIRDEKARARLEAKIRRDYAPVGWRSVAERVVGACQSAASVEWQKPYPYTELPYSTEISFGQLDRDLDGKGELLLAQIREARNARFTFDPLNEQSFLTGEEIRSTGNWALPEQWGTWLCQSGGKIAFILQEEDSEFYYIYFRVRVSHWLSGHMVRLLADNEIVWENSIGVHSRDIVLRVRKPTVSADAWLLCLEAQIDVSPELSNEIAAVDGRVPTIGFERLLVVPESDATTRVDVLTKLSL